MVPTTVIQDAVATLLANDAGTLANMTALKVKLSKTNFTPSPALTLGGVTEADFDGYAAINPTAGAQSEFIDPVTGLRTVELVPPAGGWHFHTTGLTHLPMNIYGWYVTDHTDAILYGSGLLAAPITLQLSGQAFDLPSLVFQFLNNSPQ